MDVEFEEALTRAEAALAQLRTDKAAQLTAERTALLAPLAETRTALEQQEVQRQRGLAELEQLNRRVDATMTRRWQAHVMAFGLALAVTGVAVVVLAR